MTKAEKINLANEMLLIERDGSAVTGSRLSVWPFLATSGVKRAIARAFAGKRKTVKKKVAKVISKRIAKRSAKAAKH